ncbi:MAG: hypothetical protein IKI17_02910 [Oscillospiraceae bacterium]|nr:hypothetical protein [Oscillospiraceae bacterium]
MRIKPQNVRSAILIVVVVFALIAAARFIGIGTTRSATRIGYVDKGGWHDWSASYTLLDGTLQHTLRPTLSDNLLHINVKTESGTISIEIKDTDGKIVFQQENLDTKEFDVDVEEKVSVVIYAKGHKGSFGFSFASSESTD